MTTHSYDSLDAVQTLGNSRFQLDIAGANDAADVFSSYACLLEVSHDLTVTPYDDIPIPASLTSQYIPIQSLPKIVAHPSPVRTLTYVPNALHPSLIASSYGQTSSEYLVYSTTQCRVLESPRKTLPYLPDRTSIRARDVRWLRKGATSIAQEVGVQDEMRDWRRRLEQRGIRLLDGE